jgi:hypothetical protein
MQDRYEMCGSHFMVCLYIVFVICNILVSKDLRRELLNMEN